MIYADHNSTTPIDPEVRDAILPYLSEHFGNPSSAHSVGRRARQALDKARGQVAQLINCQPEEVFFTSGATESNNWLIKGFDDFAGRPHIITSQIEHPSILRSCEMLQKRGWADVTYVPVDADCMVSVPAVEAARRANTRLLSIMLANNETGAIQPMANLLAWAKYHKILTHSDGAQAVGKIPVDVAGLGLDFLTIAGHKLYAPKGVGALFIRKGLELEPLLHGPGQERGQRGGTESVPLVVGLGQACEICHRRLSEDGARLTALREDLWGRLREQLADSVVLNGPESAHLRLPNTLSVNFRGVTGAELLQGANLPGSTEELAASTGPACHDGQVRLSHVLAAMGVAPELGRGTLRLTLGRSTRSEDVAVLADTLVGAYRKLV